MPDEGYLAGGYYQEYYNLDSKGTPGIVHQWGLITADQQLLGQGLLPTGFAGSAADRVRYAWLFRTDQAAALGALKVVGGRQNWGEVGGGVDVEDAFLWGSRTPFEVEAYSSIAYLDLERAWLYSNISFYVTAGSDSQSQGFRIVGARQQSRDLESKQPYVTISAWGDVTAQEQFIGIGQSWSQAYGWGFSQISVFLAPA
ncbi:MAG TPA: hypothetical protein VF317_12775 [Dermatophilaceae bacterium]